MVITRVSKAVLVAAMGLYAGLVAFGNLTDYGSNFAFVSHVLAMDTIFPDATIGYRAITSELIHHIAYGLIIVTEILVAVLCLMGAARIFARRAASARDFNRGKTFAIAGLTLGFVLWQVGFMSVGGEWFGMWMSQSWNGLASAFRVFITMLAVLIYVVLPDGKIDG